LTKHKGKAGRPFYAAGKSAPRSQYQDFMRSPKADEPSEQIPVDYGNDSSQVAPMYSDGSNLISAVPPGKPSSNGLAFENFLKMIYWVVGLVLLIGGILWGVFNIVRDVGDIKTSSSGIEKKAESILHKLDGQDRILNELLHRKEPSEAVRDKSGKKNP